MNTCIHPQFNEWVHHTEELKAKLERSLTHTGAWNHYDLSRLHQYMPSIINQNPSASDFATLLSLTIPMLYLHGAYNMRDKINKGVDGWFLATHYLRESIYQLIHNTPRPINKQINNVMALWEVMPVVTISEKLKTCIITIGQSYHPEAYEAGDGNFEAIRPLYEAYLCHFYPQLEGHRDLFLIPPPSVSFIVQSFTTLFPYTPPCSSLHLEIEGRCFTSLLCAGMHFIQTFYKRSKEVKHRPKVFPPFAG